MAFRSISGLREQIIANAVTAYPAEVQQHLDRTNTTIIKPSEIFDVVIMPEYAQDKTKILRFRAVITELHPDALHRVTDSTVASLGPTMEEAMMGLLVALGEIVTHNFHLSGGVPRAVQEDFDATTTLQEISSGQLGYLEEVEEGEA